MNNSNDQKIKRLFPPLAASLFFAFTIQFFVVPNATSYEGRKINAKWRQQAHHQIMKHRKANLTVTVLDQDGVPVKGARLHVKMIRHAFGFGSAVGAKMLMRTGKNFDHYRDIVTRNYNKVVLENDLKWDQWNASKRNSPKHGYYYPQTFAALQWLKDNNIVVRGHYVSWGPVKKLRTYKKFKTKPEMFRQALIKHIREKVPAVGNLVDEWDCINHPIGWNEQPITLENLYGKDIYANILRLTRKLNPQALLYINEGPILRGGKLSEIKREKFEKCIRNLLVSGAPLDGIGLMGHFTQNLLTPPTDLYRILDRFASFGLPLQITEFDLRFAKPKEFYDFSNEELQLQADYTRDFMTVMFSHPAVIGIVMWGFWEGHHHHPSAALYRKDWSVKPNGTVWNNLVFNKWWTDEHGRTDRNGVFGIRGFLGDYEILVEHNRKKVTRPVRLIKNGIEVKIVHNF